MGIIHLLPRDNDALTVHPPAGDQYLTTNGSNWLWAVMAIFLVSFLTFVALSVRPRQGERIFHYLFATALLVGGIVYFTQASDLGWQVIRQAQNDHGLTRQVFWSKYVFLVVAWPAVIVALGLLSTASWASIIYNVSLSWVWIVSYLVSAFTTTNYKWGFFAFGTMAWIVLALGTCTDGRTAANRSGVGRDYAMLSGWTVIILGLNYVIAFGISDGSNVIGVTPMFIYFGILDFMLIPVTGFAIIFLAKRWDYGRLNLHFTQYGRVRRDDAAYPEKHRGNTTAAPTAGAHPTTATV